MSSRIIEYDFKQDLPIQLPEKDLLHLRIFDWQMISKFF